jgi:hypothetical protein
MKKYSNLCLRMQPRLHTIYVAPLIVQAHWNNSTSPQVDTALHLDTLSWFRSYFLMAVNAACLAENQQKNNFYNL